MFYGAKSFNRDLSDWNVANVTNKKNMFNKAKAFNLDYAPKFNEK
jgi:surface protein